MAAALLAGFFIHRFWFVTDDAFISFRYAANWAAGDGLRYNLGVTPPVEGFSNFLWTALMAGIALAGMDVVLLAPWISSILGLGLAAAIFRFLLRLEQQSPSGRGGAVAALFFLATFPPFFVWCTGGLETMLFAILLFSTYERLLGDWQRPRIIQAGLCAALLVLTRPEGIIWAAALAGLYLADCKSRSRNDSGGARLLRPLAIYVVIFLSVAIVYSTFRFVYYERLLPNTAQIKVGLSGAVLHRGVNYVLHFALTFLTPALLIVAIPFLLLMGRRRAHSGSPQSGTDRAVVHAAVMISGCAAYSVAAGGDFMAMGRFMVPATPFFAILFAAAYTRLADRTKMPPFARLTLVAVCLAAQALPAFNLDLMPASVRETFKFRWRIPHETKSEYEQWCYMDDNQEKWAAAGKALKNYAAESDSIVLLNIGAIGYYSGLFVYDECGLVDPNVAERPPTPGAAALSAGHDKMVHPSFFLRHDPTYYQVRVIEDNEIPRYTSEVQKYGVAPQGYALKKIPLDRIDGAPKRITLMVIERIRTP